MDMDRAYVNADFIPGGADYPPRWQARAAAFRAALGARAELGRAYAAGERCLVDLFRPEGPALGLMVFVHGGYWLRFGPRDFSHLAAGALARGWAVAMPGYTLAPDARVSQITREVGAAIAAAAALVPGPMVLAGHSAGGHLVARMACTDAPLPEAVARRIARIIPISPVSELAPLLETQMNATLQLDAAEAAAESPARLPRRPGPAVTVWVGAEERPAFLWQARLLAEEWACPWHVAEGRHHFDVIDALEEPGSRLMQTLLGGL